LTDIGENYVQEAITKQSEVNRPARWHMIGHLQRNKAKRAVELFDVIHSIDHIELGRTLGLHCRARRRPARVLIEVNLGGEETKSGVHPEKLPALIRELHDVADIVLEGLMTIPPPGTPESSRLFFRRLKELRDDFGLKELSMGMTADFEIAIEEGATMVRVGTAIFGQRTQKRN